MAQHKDKPKYSKIIVSICILTIIIFTSVCMFYLWNGKPLNDTLTILFFGVFGIEFGSLAVIRRGEMRYVEGSGDKKVGHFEQKEDEDEKGSN